MILPDSGICTESSGSIKELFFSIDDKDQGIVFDILRSKIYKDPIGSICREIASNSRDANRENNKEKTPIEISIVDKNLNPMGDRNSLTIEFKDNGLGISPDRMEKIFCKYGASTKTETNRMTGGYGLGAKTPFSYTDVFNITTVFENIQYEYTAFIDESKRGKILQFSKSETDKDSGTIIKIPIKDSDRTTFEKKCIYYSILWDVRPRYINFRENISELPVVNKQSKLINVLKISKNRDIFINSMYISIDGIPYDLDKILSGFNIESFNKDFCIIFPFNNGELEISANRENLQYNSKTLETIVYRVKHVHFIISRILKIKINSFSTYKEAYGFFHCVFSTRYLNDKIKKIGEKFFGSQERTHLYLMFVKFTLSHAQFFRPADFSYKGEPLSDIIKPKYHKLIHYGLINKKLESNIISEIDSIFSIEYKVYTCEGSKNRSKILSLLEKNDSIVLIEEQYCHINKWYDKKYTKIHTIFENVKLYEISKEIEFLSLKKKNFIEGSINDIVLPKVERKKSTETFNFNCNVVVPYTNKNFIKNNKLYSYETLQHHFSSVLYEMNTGKIEIKIGNSVINTTDKKIILFYRSSLEKKSISKRISNLITTEDIFKVQLFSFLNRDFHIIGVNKSTYNKLSKTKNFTLFDDIKIEDIAVNKRSIVYINSLIRKYASTMFFNDNKVACDVLKTAFLKVPHFLKEYTKIKKVHTREFDYVKKRHSYFKDFLVTSIPEILILCGKNMLLPSPEILGIYNKLQNFESEYPLINFIINKTRNFRLSISKEEEKDMLEYLNFKQLTPMKNENN